jgi:hypothetical protein
LTQIIELPLSAAAPNFFTHRPIVFFFDIPIIFVKLMIDLFRSAFNDDFQMAKIIFQIFSFPSSFCLIVISASYQ